MGIVNITPDSFSDGGKFLEPEEAINHGLRLASDGADILDIGGESSRPGSEGISAEEEISRVLPVITELAKRTDIPISIDTAKAAVAQKALEAGATIINDITGLRGDAEMIPLAAEAGATVIIMHMLGTPGTMQKNIRYDSLLDDICEFLTTSAEKAVKAGVSEKKIIIDPGIGFGKTVEHNLEILRNIKFFKSTGYPVLIGASRKSFIGAVLETEVDDRKEGTLAVDAFVTMQGTDIIRTHDVKATGRIVRMITSLINGHHEQGSVK